MAPRVLPRVGSRPWEPGAGGDSPAPQIKGRTIRVDHVANYRPPKESEDWDDVTRALDAKGCGVKTPPHTSSDSPSEDEEVPVKKQKGEECSWQVGSQVCVPMVGFGGWSLRGGMVGGTEMGTK